MKTFVLCALAVVGLSSPLAAQTSMRDYQPEPPVVQGTVVSVNDLGLVVDTETGGEVKLLMDSRTLVPNDLEAGMVMRAEFQVLDSGALYARRIVPLRNDADAKRRLAYAGPGHSDNYATASYDADDRTSGTDADRNDESSTVTNGTDTGQAPAEATAQDRDQAEDRAEEARDNASTSSSGSTNEIRSGDANATDDTDASKRNDLPGTASHLPLVAGLGALALVGGALTMWSRRVGRA